MSRPSARPFRAIEQIARILTDFRFAVRAVIGRPAFAVAAVLTLGLGIGANTAVFSAVNAILLRKLPYTEPERLAMIWPAHTFANRHLEFVRLHAKSFDAVAIYSPGWLMALTGVPEPRQLSASRISANLFGMLGVRPALGRTFEAGADQPGQDQLAVLGDELWRSVFRADPGIIGKSIALDGTRYVVIGVMPAGFQIRDTGADLWTPMTMDRDDFSWRGEMGVLVGRLRAGTTVATAGLEMPIIAEQMKREFGHPDDWSRGADVVGLQDVVVGSSRTTLLIALGAAVLVLLVALANVANLLLVRTAERRQELAVRMSLGASAGQVARLLLAEGAVLAGCGGALGLALAFGAVGVLRATLPASTPRLAEIGVDGRVFWIAMAVVVLTAVLLGLATFFHAMRHGTSSELRHGRAITRGARRSRGLLVAAEVAFALILTSGALLMTRTVRELGRVDPGFAPDHLLILHVQPPPLGTGGEAVRSYWRDVLTRVRAIPGVVNAATVLHVPMGGRRWDADLEVEGRPLEPGAAKPRGSWQSISLGYLETARIPLIRGRGFASTDRADAPRVALINTVFAGRLFPGEDPIGHRLRAGHATNEEWATIVGVVGSVRHDSLNTPPQPEMYLPFEQLLVGANAVIVRTQQEPEPLAPAIRASIWSVNANVPISGVRSMDEVLRQSIERQRAVLGLLGAFALLGLAVSSVGIYGVVAYAARQRTAEIGIRIALGAEAGSLVRLVVSDGLHWTLVGVTLGVLGGLGLARFLQGLLFGVVPSDPLTFVGSAASLAVVALGASYLPARRAARTNPTEALRDSAGAG